MAIPRGVYRDARRTRYQRKSEPAVGFRLLSNAQAGLLGEPYYPSRHCRESLARVSHACGRNTLTVD